MKHFKANLTELFTNNEVNLRQTLRNNLITLGFPSMGSDEKLIRHKHADALDAGDQALLATAAQHLELAYAPYSGFHVGAALLSESGKVIGGANQENASYSMCMCAERVALYNASMNIPGDRIMTMAIVVKGRLPLDSPAPPCGGCLQVLSEYEHRQNGAPIRILLKADGDEVLEASSVKVLLPHAFNGSVLL